MARLGAERVCSRLRDTPETPGEAWGPPCNDTRRWGTESPRVVLPRGAGVNRRRHARGIPQAANAAGKARGDADVGTGIACERDESRGRGREHALERCLDNPRGGGAN